jgi:ATP-binding cassette subfamily B protein
MRTAGAWRHVWGLARSLPGPFTRSWLIYFAVFAAVLVPGLIARVIFDTLSGHARAGLNIWTLIALRVAVEVARFSLLYITGWQLNVFRLRAETLMKGNMMRWLVAGPGVRRLPDSAGEAVSRFRDDVGEVVGLGLAMLTSPQLLAAIVALSIMVSINGLVTLAVLPPLILTLWITYGLRSGLQIRRKASREAGARVTSFIGESFGAVLAIKLAGAEPRVIVHLDALNDTRRKASIIDTVYSAGLTSLHLNIIALGTGAVLLLAAAAMRAGSFTIGDYALFTAYLGPAAGVPLYIGQVVAMERQATTASTRMAEILDGAEPDALTRRPPRVATEAQVSRDDALRTLTLRGLTARHGGSGRGVEGVDLTLTAGSFTVVTGKVAAGKTTLLRAMLGLLPMEGGAVLWNGREVDDPASFLIPPRCAYTAQAPRLFSETLGDNIRMGHAATLDKVAAAVALAVFDEDMSRFESGLATLVGTRGVTLSGGQVQRAAAARMFLRAPDLLVFDDVSSALDVRTEQLLWRRLFAGGGRTCLAVSHRHAAFQRADQIIVLAQGKVAAAGDLATLRRDSALFREIWQEG